MAIAKKNKNNNENEGKVKAVKSNKNTVNNEKGPNTHKEYETEDAPTIYSIHFNKDTTVKQLKEILEKVSDDTLVRVAGQSNGFAQVDTMYPDLNFCIPEEISEDISMGTPNTVYVGKKILYFANAFKKMLNDDDLYGDDELTVESLVQACDELQFNYDRFVDVIEAIAEGSEETAITVDLQRDILAVLGLSNIIFNYMKSIASDNYDDCDDEDDNCDYCDTCEDHDLCEDVIHEVKKYIKTLKKVTSVCCTTKLHINLNAKKKLTDEQKALIIQQFVPDGISELSLKCGYDYCMDIKYSQNISNPFGKKAKIKNLNKKVSKNKVKPTLTLDNAVCVDDDEDED